MDSKHSIIKGLACNFPNLMFYYMVLPFLRNKNGHINLKLMMINEDRTMVGSLGEEVCVTSGMAIASLDN